MAAIRAAQLGLRGAVVEKEEVGGLCLNWGCIPSKALLKNAEVLETLHRAGEFGITFDNLQVDMGKAIDRSRQVVDRMVKGVHYLLKKNKIDFIRGEGYLSSPNQVEVRSTGQTLNTDNVIIATGARPKAIPQLPVDGHRVITSREALELREVPSSIAIIGGGATGVEFAYFYRAYGARVTLIEMMPHLLPNEDEEIAQLLEKAFDKKGIEVLSGTIVETLEERDGHILLSLSSSGDQKQGEYDYVLVAVGMQGNVDGMGLEELGVGVEKGFIKIDDHMTTNVSGIYAIGDVTGKTLLAHVASAQGHVVAEAIAGRDTVALNYENMPRATYCQPQVASLGLTEAQAVAQGHQIKVGRFPFRANGKALGIGEPEGMVKIVADAQYGDIVGAHLIGHEVTEMLAELSLAKTLEATPLEIGNTVHAHPTLSEALKEAALDVDNEAIHM